MKLRHCYGRSCDVEIRLGSSEIHTFSGSVWDQISLHFQAPNQDFHHCQWSQSQLPISIGQQPIRVCIESANADSGTENTPKKYISVQIYRNSASAAIKKKWTPQPDQDFSGFQQYLLKTTLILKHQHQSLHHKPQIYPTQILVRSMLTLNEAHNNPATHTLTKITISRLFWSVSSCLPPAHSEPGPSKF